MSVDLDSLIKLLGYPQNSKGEYQTPCLHCGTIYADLDSTQAFMDRRACACEGNVAHYAKTEGGNAHCGL